MFQTHTALEQMHWVDCNTNKLTYLDCHSVTKANLEQIDAVIIIKFYPLCIILYKYLILFQMIHQAGGHPNPDVIVVPSN